MSVYQGKKGERVFVGGGVGPVGTLFLFRVRYLVSTWSDTRSLPTVECIPVATPSPPRRYVRLSDLTLGVKRRRGRRVGPVSETEENLPMVLVLNRVNTYLHGSCRERRENR